MKKEFFFALTLITLLSCLNSYNERKKRFDNQIGTYQIDLNQSNLGAYISDSLFYSNLQITFFEDSTYMLNMDVPFILDSSGTWSVGTDQLYQWNYLMSEKIGGSDQFYQCCDEDSTFVINSVTPKKGFNPVLKIYFKKISSEPSPKLPREKNN